MSPPDGYGDGMPSWAIDVINRRPHHREPASWASPPMAMSACARICRVMGLGKRDTLKVLGLKPSNENYRWLQGAWGDE